MSIGLKDVGELLAAGSLDDVREELAAEPPLLRSAVIAQVANGGTDTDTTYLLGAW